MTLDFFDAFIILIVVSLALWVAHIIIHPGRHD